jgi:hypothetical protein
MPGTVAFTLAEAATILDPPMTEQQMRALIRVLGWQPDGKRYSGQVGHPPDTFGAERIMRLHAWWTQRPS